MSIASSAINKSQFPEISPSIHDSADQAVMEIPFAPDDVLTKNKEVTAKFAKVRKIGAALLRNTVVTPFERIIETPYEMLKDYRTKTLTGAVAKGAALGIPLTVEEYGQTIMQTGRDAATIWRLEAALNQEISESGVKEKRLDKTKRTLAKVGLAGWYVPAAGYQLFDDLLTYPLFLSIQENSDTVSAYGIAGAAGFGLAASMGIGQRAIEKSKAKLMHVETVTDTSDHGRRILDAAVNSAPWQVALAAGKTRETGEPIPLVTSSKIAQYAGAYALANTALYTAADSLPMGEWTGFGVSLAAVWTLGGVYSSVKEHNHNKLINRENI